MLADETIQLSEDLLNYVKLAASEHLLWLQSEGRDGRRANMAGQDLSGLTLKGIYLPEASFRGAVLIGTDFSEANLQGADFSEAVLENTNFREASLEGANFSRCSAKSAYFDFARAVDVNFSNAILEGASAQNTDFSGAKFRDALLNRSNFSQSVFVHTNLRYSRAVECIFDKADLSHADCRDCIFDYTRLKSANLTEANMRGASFEQVVFTDTDFSRAIDLEPRYQTESIELEKQSIRQEIDNLHSVKEEVSQYEYHIREQKRDINNRKRILEGLSDLENEVSDALVRYLKLFRQIASFWFVTVALFATVLTYRIMQMQQQTLDYVEIAAIGMVLAAVLGAHVISAALSYRVAKKFASYVRMRREKLAVLNDAETANEPQPGDPDHPDSDVTYL